MRRFILIYIVCSVYRPSNCDYQQLFEIVEREHPKKANLLTDFRHLQYLNPVKVITRKPNYRRFGSENAYTLFPPVESRRVGVPDSPYFPLEKNMEAKSRVKKVMADAALRYKRSADINASSVQPNDVPKLNESVPILNTTEVASENKHAIIRRDTKVAKKPAAAKAAPKTIKRSAPKGKPVANKKKNPVAPNKNAKKVKSAPARKGRQNIKKKSIKRKAPAGNGKATTKRPKQVTAKKAPQRGK